jgi:hypothetical protein
MLFVWFGVRVGTMPFCDLGTICSHSCFRVGMLQEHKLDHILVSRLRGLSRRDRLTGAVRIGGLFVWDTRPIPNAPGPEPQKGERPVPRPATNRFPRPPSFVNGFI